MKTALRCFVFLRLQMMKKMETGIIITSIWKLNDHGRLLLYIEVLRFTLSTYC